MHKKISLQNLAALIIVVFLFLLLLPEEGTAATIKVLSTPNVVQPYSGVLGTIEIDDLYLTGPDQISIVLPQGTSFMVRDPARLIEVPRMLPDTSVINGVYQDEGPGFSNAFVNSTGSMLTFTVEPGDDPLAEGNSGTVLVHMPLNLFNAAPGPLNVQVRDTAFQLPLPSENTPGNAIIGSQLKNATTPVVISSTTLTPGTNGDYVLQVTTTGRYGAAGAGTNIWFDLPEHFTWANTSLIYSGGWNEGDVKASTVKNDQGNSRLLLSIDKAPSGIATVRVEGKIEADSKAPAGKIEITYGGNDPAIGLSGTLVIGQCMPGVSPVTESKPQVRNIGFIIGQKSYTLDGQVYSMDTAPFNWNNRVYIPVRYLVQSLGATENSIAWDEKSQTANISLKNTAIKLAIGSRTCYINGRVRVIDAPPLEKDGRIFLPIRYVADILCFHVGWDASTGTVSVTG